MTQYSTHMYDACLPWFCSRASMLDSIKLEGRTNIDWSMFKHVLFIFDELRHEIVAVSHDPEKLKQLPSELFFDQDETFGDFGPNRYKKCGSWSDPVPLEDAGLSEEEVWDYGFLGAECMDSLYLEDGSHEGWGWTVRNEVEFHR